VEGNQGANPPLPWFAAPRARSWRCPVPEPVSEGEVRAFHQGLPGYEPTPLREVPALAAALGTGRAFVKDESARLGLTAFKVLGASWAVHQLLTRGQEPGGQEPGGQEPGGQEPGGQEAGARRGDGEPGVPAGLPRLRALAARRPGLAFVTATDGNHGRAVARMARLVGVPAQVFLPAVAAPAARQAIAGEGAQVTRIDGHYDEAVDAARRWARERPGTALVQDTAWPGYEQVPGWIVEGYSTLFGELDGQLTGARAGTPALVVVPVGVGSLAQAAVAHYRSPAAAPGTAVLSVEPDAAACLLASLRAGRPVSVATAGTIMAGLNCGTVSSVAWPYLAAGLDAAVTVNDAAARRAAADLAAAGVSSGPSGAAALAGARAALTGPGSAARRGHLAVHADSVVVLLNTEAAP
jgi:diaminopropionate ammonia-lyase